MHVYDLAAVGILNEVNIPVAFTLHTDAEPSAELMNVAGLLAKIYLTQIIGYNEDDDTDPDT